MEINTETPAERQQDRERSLQDDLSESKLYLPYNLVDLPLELLVYIFSFLTSARDRVKLRYVSQLLRAAVETPSLWRDFTWPHFDHREERSIKSVLKLSGRHVKRICFPGLAKIPVKLLQHCGNVIQFSVPSVKLSVNQLRTAMRSMKQLQHLDVSWITTNDAKQLLMLCTNLKELTIREQPFTSFHSGFLLVLLNQWTASQLKPYTLNIVVFTLSSVINAIERWMCLSPNSANHTSYLKVYQGFKVFIGLAPAFPAFQLHFDGQSCTVPYIVASNFGLLGLEKDRLVLSDRVINDHKVHKVMMVMSGGDILGGPLKLANIEFLTHFVAAQCNIFFSGHLEQLAAACPNLKELNLLDNVNCLRNLRGLRAVANSCQNLEGLNIIGIPASEVECCVKLWEILADLQLSYLAIELCCLQCFEENSKEIIIGFHQKCIKMKALESYYENHCLNCTENDRPLQMSNFPSLIHCIMRNTDIADICDNLKYLKYTGENLPCAWPNAIHNLEQLSIISDQLSLTDGFMHLVSAHGGLVHVILSVNFVTQNGITALIENSPNLITCHIHVRTGTMWRILFNPKDFKSRLQRKYSHRKLFLCGRFHLVKGKICAYEFCELLREYTVDLASLWRP